MFAETIARDVDPSISEDLFVLYVNLKDIHDLWIVRNPSKAYKSLSDLIRLVINNAVEPAVSYPDIKNKVLEVKFYHFFSYFDEKGLTSLIRLPRTSKGFSPAERESFMKRKKDCIDAYLRLSKHLFSRVRIGYLDALKVNYQQVDRSLWDHVPEELKELLNQPYLNLI